MGGGMQFLNKKSWHTGGMRQMEAVWKREQEHAKEQSRLKELQQQIRDERENQELQRLAEDNRHQERREERVEFMYNTPLAASGAANDQQAFLLGEKRVTDALLEQQAVGSADAPAGTSQCERVTQLPSVYTDDTPQSRNEIWTRLNEDPLLAIRRQQQSSLARIKRNPVQMRAIKHEVRAMREERGERSHAASTGARDGGEPSRRRHHEDGGRTHGERSSHRRRRRHHGESDDRRHRHRHRHARSSSSHTPAPASAPALTANPPNRSRSRSRSPPPPSRGYGLQAPGWSDGPAADVPGSRGAAAPMCGVRSAGRFSAKESIARAEQKEREAPAPAEGGRGGGQGGGRGGGRRAARHMSEAEKEAMRAAMAGDAASHAQAREDLAGRSVREAEREAAMARAAGAHPRQAAFLDAAQRRAFGADDPRGDGREASLGDALGRRRFYSQRG